MLVHKICFKLLILFFVCINFISVNRANSQSGWTNQTIGSRKYVNVNFINSTSGYLVGSDGSILKTTNFGSNWNVISFRNFGATVKNGSIYNDRKYMIISGSLGGMVYSTNDSGKTWISGGEEIYPIGGGNGIIGLKGINIVSNLTAYVCGFDFGTFDKSSYVNGIIYKSTNSGVNWFQSFRGGVDYYDIKFNNSIGYCSWSAVMKSTDNGNIWNYVGDVLAVTFSLSNFFNDTLYMSGDSGKVYRTLNGGFNWTKFYTPASDTLRRIFFTDSKTGYAVGNGGKIVKTSNAGINWTLQNSGTTRNLNSIWFINKDTGFVVGDNGIVLRTFSGGLLVNVNSNNEATLDKFILYQNYPNPLNPSTTIKFNIPKSGFVKLKVYDISGKVVDELVNENLNAGTYSYNFLAKNLSSGMYFYTLEANGFTNTKKLMLIK